MKRVTAMSLLLTSAAWTVGGCAFQPHSRSTGRVAVVRRTPDPVASLKRWLATSPRSRQPLGRRNFAALPLTRRQAQEAFTLLWMDYVRRHRRSLEAEWRAKAIRVGAHTMRFEHRTFGNKPQRGWPLYISLHGGGGAPAHVNDGQWRNQIALYTPSDAIYLAPRAPTNTWNLWHQAHVDQLLSRLLEGAFMLKDVDPNRVYLMGYSAGGDGVYQLAPRMPDRFAAAAMMAGHPNEASPLGLRNLGFTIHVGELDRGYKRNEVAVAWGRALAKLRAADPEGYRHKVTLHKGMGHWMRRKDRVALAWMAGLTRDPLPKRVVWRQDDVLHRRFYWLALNKGQLKAGTGLTAHRQGQRVTLSGVVGVSEVTILLNDKMMNLARPVTITYDGKTLFYGRAKRTIQTVAASLRSRHDRSHYFTAQITVKLPPPGS